MRRATHRIFLFLSLMLLANPETMPQGIKGADARRHAIPLLKHDVRAPDETGRDSLGMASDSVALVLVVGKAPLDQADPEVTAALGFVKLLSRYKAEYISLGNLCRQKKLLNRAKAVWFHRADISEFTKTEVDPSIIKLLHDYIEKGGALLLTLDGFRYLNPLGVESVAPSVRYKQSVDEGYGRKLGFHSFRSHPLFNGLNGGAYIYIPDRDTTVRIVGFFGDTVPEKGKVVAIDWDYIFFRENSKLIVEYTVGKGKVLAVGGYTLFAPPNENRRHLEAFTRNVLDYLTGGLSDESGHHWDYSSPGMIPCPPKEQNRDLFFAAIPVASKWDLPPAPLSFPVHPATAAYCEAAGERILMMGTEQGGIEEIWIHPFMALRDYRSGIRDPGSDSTLWLSDLPSEVEVRSDGFVRQYHAGGGMLREVVMADPLLPCGVVHYEWNGPRPVELTIRFGSNLRLMWPYPSTCTGLICYGWDEDYHAVTIRDKSGELCVITGANKAPERHQAESGEGDIIQVSATYSLAPGEPLDVVMTGGSEGYDKALNQFDETIRDPYKIAAEAAHHGESLLAERLMVTTPDSNFNAGFRWALLGTDRFFVSTPGMGSALVAGYGTTRRGWDGAQKVSGRPGYAWYFGRDGEWSGFALLDYGDFEKVRMNLEFFLKYQDLSGKIFHEATTSGVIHYDAADATPLFIVLAGKYIRHSGDTAFLRTNWPAIKKAVDFCFSTDSDGDHLIENTRVGHGWVEGGELYGSHASFYLTGCWAAALEEASHMGEVMQDPSATRYRQELKTVKGLIDQRFWSPQERFYAYGINQNGSKRTDPTILPAVPASFGLTDRFLTRTILDQYASNAFSTNWGIRIIREDSPLFKPTGYHYGSVWPLFTGWASLAEYRYGNHIQGFSHIMNNLNVYRNWGLGFIEEVLNGAEYHPSGVCPHQCWSETMVLQPVIEGMLGLEVYSGQNTVRLAPRLPADWDSLTVSCIRIGDQLISMRFLRDSGTMRWEFSSDLTSPVTLEFMPALPPGTRVEQLTVNGEDHPCATFTTSRFITLQLTIPLLEVTVVELTYTGGISALPVIPSPVPGDPAEGMRILDTQLKGVAYRIDVEGLAGTADTLSIWSQELLSAATGGECMSRKDRTTKFLVQFPSDQAKYVRTSVTLTLPNKQGNSH